MRDNERMLMKKYIERAVIVYSREMGRKKLPLTPLSFVFTCWSCVVLYILVCTGLAFPGTRYIHSLTRALNDICMRPSASGLDDGKLRLRSPHLSYYKQAIL